MDIPPEFDSRVTSVVMTVYNSATCSNFQFSIGPRVEARLPRPPSHGCFQSATGAGTWSSSDCDNAVCPIQGGCICGLDFAHAHMRFLICKCVP